MYRKTQRNSVTHRETLRDTRNILRKLKITVSYTYLLPNLPMDSFELWLCEFAFCVNNVHSCLHGLVPEGLQLMELRLLLESLLSLDGVFDPIFTYSSTMPIGF